MGSDFCQSDRSRHGSVLPIHRRDAHHRAALGTGPRRVREARLVTPAWHGAVGRRLHVYSRPGQGLLPYPGMAWLRELATTWSARWSGDGGIVRPRLSRS